MQQTAPGEDIFTIVPQRLDGRLSDLVSQLARPIEQLLGLRRCRHIYSRVAGLADPRLFMRGILSTMNLHPTVRPADIANIPKSGPCVVVANHPFGGIEGVILADLMLSVRPDVKVMANYLLNRMPQMREIVIPVDPFEGAAAARANLGPLRRAMRWVKAGGLLVMFPAGEVSHFSLTRREVSDPPWSPAAGRIIRAAQATALPVFFKGRNSALFQAAGLIHPRLRTALLARELVNKEAAAIQVKIGAPIPFRWLRRYAADAPLVAYLRWRTYVLGYTPRRGVALPPIPGISKTEPQKPLAAPQPAPACRREVAGLPNHQRLVASGVYSVWVAPAAQIPTLLREIGRLREQSFRLAGEGTSRARDTDRFDAHYLHLFIWNEEASEIVGAYRLGPTDEILKRFGRAGLYTTTLFDSQVGFFEKLGPALELGRSFIRPEYQKSYSPLLLLWKGIGSYIACNPRYRMLFGPVSISRDFSDLSRRLMATTLLRHSQARDLALMVRPKRPPHLQPVRIPGARGETADIHFQDFKEVCSVIGDIEFQQRDVPVLLRQYLNLGGQLLAFNLDRKFGNVMDGLIVVDLLQTDRKTLNRYMGPAGAEALFAWHRSPEDDAGASRPNASPSAAFI